MDDYEAEELRRKVCLQRRREHQANRTAFMGEEAEEIEWPNPNQPHCATAAIAVIAARKAIQLAMSQKNSKVEERKD